MQVYFDEKLGGDGGRVQAVNDEGVLKLQFSFPFRKFLDLTVPRFREPAIKLVEKAIPGTAFDKYAPNVVDGILKMVGYEHEAKAEVQKTEPETQKVVSEAAPQS